MERVNNMAGEMIEQVEEVEKKKPGRKPREVVEDVAAQDEDPAPVAPVKSGFDLAGIASAFNARFTPHEHGGIFEKGTRKVSLNVANYNSEHQVRKILEASGF